MTGKWLLDGAAKDHQTINARWTPEAMQLIDGVSLREVLHVPKSNGYLTEIYRREWTGDAAAIDQVFQVILEPGAISAWHAHAETTDRIFITHGLVHLALYDAREDSPTRGLVNDLRLGTIRPALVVVPPRVWHGLRNLASTTSTILNLVDRAYDYEDPDHWRLPADTPEIPFRL